MIYTEMSEQFMRKPLKTTPSFANEAGEKAFWNTHDSIDYLDWSQAKKAPLPTLSQPPRPFLLGLPLI